MDFIRFLFVCTRHVLRGGRLFLGVLGLLGVIVGVGAFSYARQLREGLIVTGMSDQVTWGVYISNFTFLVGLAAAAVLLVIPAYVFHNRHAKHVVLLGEGVAVAACVMALLFVVVDLGRPDRMWHLVAELNFPTSLLAWDIVVLPGYLLLNLCIPMYVLHHKYAGREPPMRRMFPVLVLTMFWAIALHIVTAFLFSSNPARPFWHSALLGPRFLASAFAAGPAFMIVAFRVLAYSSRFKIPPEVIRLLALIATVALQVNLVMLGAEVFTEFYAPTEHSISAEYLFVGLPGATKLVPWIWTAIAMELIAVVLLTVTPLRNRPSLLLFACVLTAGGIWIEKGMGLIIPGFIPGALGEVLEYAVTWTEILICAGIWALGIALFMVLARVAVAIDLGDLRAAGVPRPVTEP